MIHNIADSIDRENDTSPSEPYLIEIRVPEESQKIQRILEAFSEFFLAAVCRSFREQRHYSFFATLSLCSILISTIRK
ncbi:hypothetical protein ACFX13_018075 [Malus domestica]